MKEFADTRVGPGKYSVSHNMTERRDDFGVVKIKRPFFEVNPRDQIDERPELHPNFDIDKPNKLVFRYHSPSKDLEPQHTPEKAYFPEKWKFYDYDLDVIREEVAKEITFAKNLSLDTYKDKEEFYNLLVEHNKRQEKRPAVGTYDPERPEAKIEVDFSKAQGRVQFVDDVRETGLIVICRNS